MVDHCIDCIYYIRGCTKSVIDTKIHPSSLPCNHFERRTVYKVEDLPENQTLISKSDTIRIVQQHINYLRDTNVTFSWSALIELSDAILSCIGDLPCFCQDDLHSNKPDDDEKFVNARQPTTHESDANYDVLSVMRDNGLKPDAETLRFILSQYQKIITEMSHGMLSKLTYLADEYINTFRERDTQSDKWISCNDRLPELKKDVLIYAVRKDLQDDESQNDEGNHVFAITSMSDELWIGHAIKTEPYWVAPFEFFRQNYSVTHWMELPENPEVNMSLA